MVLVRLALVLFVVMAVGAAVPGDALPGVGLPQDCGSGLGYELGGTGVCCDPNHVVGLRPGHGCRNK